MLKAIITATVLGVSATCANAIVVNETYGTGSGFNSTEYSAVLGFDAAFDGIAHLYNSAGSLCSGTLISSKAILTARHCTDGKTAANWTATFATGGSVHQYGVSGVTSLPGAPGNESTYFNGTDLAILHLASAVTVVEPVKLLSQGAGREVFGMVGWGLNGTGTQGDVTYDGFRRYGENTLDAYGSGYDGNRVYYADFDDETGTSNTLNTEFGANSSSDMLELEALGGGGDSGGAMLLERDGEYVLHGVLTGHYSFNGNTRADYGAIGTWTGFTSQSAIDLIRGAGGVFFDLDAASPVPVPLPAGLYLLGASVVTLRILRRLACGS